MNKIEKSIFLISLICIVLMSILLYYVYLENKKYYKNIEYFSFKKGLTEI